ncbi:MAG: aquaporin [Candidatus Omnitrophica bacterium]|nr:aquaporin [Candidatus Omnitrophota bacterium]
MKNISWNKYMCEFFGTAIFIFLGLTGIYLADLAQFPDFIEFAIIGFAFAAGLICVFYSYLGQTSGCHVNPAVTLAFLVKGDMSKKDAVWYIVFQLLGATLGALVAFLLYDCNWLKARLTLTLPADNVSNVLAIFIEAVLTGLLVTLVFCFVSSEKYVKKTGLAAGAYIFVVTVLFASLTGASMNPARSFGPAFLLKDFNALWIYFAGPFLGASLAGLGFRKNR